jgi:hypothetical protein
MMGVLTLGQDSGAYRACLGQIRPNLMRAVDCMHHTWLVQLDSYNQEDRVCAHVSYSDGVDTSTAYERLPGQNASASVSIVDTHLACLLLVLDYFSLSKVAPIAQKAGPVHLQWSAPWPRDASQLSARSQNGKSHRSTCLAVSACIHNTCLQYQVPTKFGTSA